MSAREPHGVPIDELPVRSRLPITIAMLTATGLIALAGCGTGVEEFMPLQEGSWWEFETTVLMYVGVMEFDVTTGLRYSEVMLEEESESNGTLFWVAKLMEDVHISYLNCISLEDGRVTVYDGPEAEVGQVYLQEPLDTGNSWVSYAWGDTSSEVFSEIVSTDEALDLPAGTFNDCLQVRMSFRSDVLNDHDGAEDILWAIWFAPGVGIVKTVMSTTNEKTMFSRKTVTELAEYFIAD